jgi:hypothetical protein
VHAQSLQSEHKVEQSFDPTRTVVGTVDERYEAASAELDLCFRGVIGPRSEMLRRARPAGADWARDGVTCEQRAAIV